MANFNKVILIGNLTRDPELRYTQSGMALVKFGLAVNRKYRSKGSQEMVEETTFVDIEGWGASAETFNQYMKKGRPVFVEGRLRLDRWESKEGQKQSRLCVVMENFQFLGAGGGGGGGGGSDGGGLRSARDSGASSGGDERGGGESDRARAGHVADRGQAKPQGEDYDFEDIPF